MLLAERFIPGLGWVEIALLSIYAAWITSRMANPAASPRWRARIWLFFSVVFFSQLVLGIAGVEECLMTGNLHLPIPALVVAGPIYRGGGYFMLLLHGAERPVGRKSVLGVGVGVAIDLEGKALLGFFGIGDFPSLLCPPHLPSLRAEGAAISVRH
jgi:hypothetical protein